ncbi:hypothetical protein ACQJBY_004908 [Aegilops geniculata]
MEGTPRLTAGAVREIWELPDGPGTIQPVLQVADLRAVTTKNPVGHQSERYRMLLSDGVHSQQSMLSTNHNHLVKTGALRQGSIVHLQDITCNTIQNRRIIIVVELDVLLSECDLIGKPKIYDKSLPAGQVPNLPAGAAQANSGNHSNGPGMLGNCVAPRVEQISNNQSYGGPYNGVHSPADPSIGRTLQPGPKNVSSGGSYGTMPAQNTMNGGNMAQPNSQRPYNGVHSPVGPSIGRTVQPGPNNVLPGGSYGAMSAQNTMNGNMVQPNSQRPLLNSHQNQRFAVPGAGGGISPPGNVYGHPAQPSYQQPPPAYTNSGPAAKNGAALRTVPISALNPYQRTWTIKARVAAKSQVKHYNNARGPGKLFNFDLRDAHGGEIRAVCFNTQLDQFYDLIEVDKVYLISRGSLKPANKQFNHLNNDYEVSLDAATTIEVCSDDDSSIPRQQFDFRQISEIANMDKDTMVDLLGVVTSVSPSSPFTRKDGVETQKRVLQLRDMSGCSVEITFWGGFCNAEGQQLQSLCDSGSNPVLALRSVRVGEFKGRNVSTIGSSFLKINPDFPAAESLRQWYITEGKNAACTSLSMGGSGMGRTDDRKTVEQIKAENLGRSEKPDWITVKGAISHISTDNFCYPACTTEVNGTRCNKKVTNNGDGMWQCDKCEQSTPNCEYRYMLQCQIQDYTGTSYATAFHDAGKDIIGLPAQDLYRIKHEEQDDEKFADIIQKVRFELFLFKLKVKEEVFNDEPRVKCYIVNAQKLEDTSKESRFLLGPIDSLLVDDGLGPTPGVSGVAAVSTGFTSNTGTYSMNMSGPNQFGQRTSSSSMVPATPSATRYSQNCSVCGSNGHSVQNCPAVAMDMQQPAASGYAASSYGSSPGDAGSGLCFKCNQPGHFSRDCPQQEATSYRSPAANANANSGLCYKCNQPGHFSRDCPGQAANSYDASAGGNAGAGGLCFKCNQPGHFSRDCPGQAANSYGASAGGNAGAAGLCYKCNQPGHFARDCQAQAAAPQRQAYGNGAASGGYNRQYYVGSF